MRERYNDDSALEIVGEAAPGVVCQRDERLGARPDGRHAPRLSPAPATDTDDLAGVCLWRAANGDQFRGWLQQPARGRDWRHGRYDFGDDPGYLFRPAVLCAGSSPFPAEGTP